MNPYFIIKEIDFSFVKIRLYPRIFLADFLIAAVILVYIPILQSDTNMKDLHSLHRITIYITTNRGATMNRRRNINTLAKLLVLTLFCLLQAYPVWAQSVEIIAEGSYQMGDNDTPAISEERALLKAKRNALEQAGTYMTSSTTVKNLQVTEDNLSALSAGVLKVTIVDTQRTQVGNGMEVKVKIKAMVDTEKLENAIQNAANASKTQLAPSTQPALPSELQFNGYYQYTSMIRNLKRTTYYRFFPDGKVNAVSYFADSTPAPNDLFEVLHRSPGGMGAYSVQGGELRFSIDYPKGKLEGKGKISGESLLLSFYSHITKTNGQQTCWFVKIK